MTIGLVTSSAYPLLPPDEAALVEALRALGHDAVPLGWSDPAVRWERYDACVVRATWDFHLRHREFEEWLERAAAVTRLVNPAPLMRWNVRKRYLIDLEDRGVAIVPTILLPAGGISDPSAIARSRQWPQFVLKPEISASSYRTELFDADADARDFLRLIHSGGDALLQPYVADVRAGGERSYVVIDGMLTHVVRRAPFNGGARGIAQPRVPARPDEQQLAATALAALPGTPVYARVDVVRLENGTPAVAEVELIEPALFFSHAGRAAQRLAAAVVALAEG